MFQIETFTYARLASITSRVEKHGDDDKPAVSMRLEIEGPNTLLDVIDPSIRHALYKAVDDQDQLPGVEPATPVLRCNSFDKHALTTAHEGWTLAIDYGIDQQDPMQFGGCKVDKFHVEAKQGGSIVLSFRVGTSDIDADKGGKLLMHNGDDIAITLKAPEKKAEAIDGTTAAFERDHPGASAGYGEGDATDLFAQTSSAGGAVPDDNGHDGDGSEGGDPDAGGDEPDRGDDWPFPQSVTPDAPPQSVTVDTSRPGTRTARGREKTKAALATGLAAARSESTHALAHASDAAQEHIAAVGAKLEGAES